MMNQAVVVDAHELADAMLGAHATASAVHGIAMEMLVKFGDDPYPIGIQTADALALAAAMAAADAAMKAMADAEKVVREMARRAEGRK